MSSYSILASSCLAAVAWGWLAPAPSASAAGAPTFDPSTAVVRNATEIVPQPDGKLIVVYPGDPSGEALSRFNADGTTDAGFNTSAIRIGQLDSVSLLSSGKLLLAGSIATEPGGGASDKLVKLNADGSVDPGFQPGSAFGANPVVQADGCILVLGGTPDAHGSVHPTLERLKPGGAVDASYQPGAALLADGSYALALQSDGRLLLIGEDGVSSGQANLLRLNADGSLDSAFTPPDAVTAGHGVSAVAAAADGKLLVAVYTSDDDDACVLSRLLPDGTADPAFIAPVAFDGSVDDIAFLPDGGTLVSGGFSLVHGIARNGFARLGADGGVDASFHPIASGAEPFYGFVMTAGGGVTYATGQAPANGSGGTNPGVLIKHDGAGNSSAWVERVDSCAWCSLTLRPDGSGVYVDALDQQIPAALPPSSSPAATPGSLVPLDANTGIAPPPSPGGPVVSDRPLVTLKAVRPRVYSGGTLEGKFLLTRTGDLTRELTVPYTIKGSAIAGRDYQPLRGYRTMMAGNARARIRIKPMHDSFRYVRGGSAAVKLVIEASSEYDVAKPGTARVRIINRSASRGQ